MKFKETDIHLMTDGMGIVFYSPETNKNILEGCNFFEEEYSKPDSGTWGDKQTIFVYLNKLDSMPELAWPGMPLLLPQ